jgi:hypothetical protein
MTNLRPPKVEDVVERLKQLGRDLSLYKSPKHVAKIYLAAVGLLTLLKQDQATLHRHHQLHNNAAFRYVRRGGVKLRFFLNLHSRGLEFCFEIQTLRVEECFLTFS